MIRLGIMPLMWLTATAAAASVPEAQALWERGAYRQAVAAAFEPANANDAQAQFILGEAYRLGRSVEPDDNQAREWYLRAARRGDVPSAAALGELLLHMRQSHEAVPWLSLAASHDNPRATALLAAIYFTGDGADQNIVLATSLMKKAAALGSPEARAKLAMMGDAAPPVDVSSSPAQRAVTASQDNSARVRVASAFSDAPVRQVVRRYSPVKRRGILSAVPFQVGAFRSATNARTARQLVAARITGTSSDLMIVRNQGYYKVLVLSDGRAHADSVGVQLTKMGWQHFARITGSRVHSSGFE